MVLLGVIKTVTSGDIKLDSAKNYVTQIVVKCLTLEE